MANAHRPPVRQLSTGGSVDHTEGGVGFAPQRPASEAEYESSHRRRKVYAKDTGAFWFDTLVPHAQ